MVSEDEVTGEAIVYEAELVPLSQEELVRLEQSRVEFEAHEAELANREALRLAGVAKLMALGLTEEEARAIAGS